MSDLSVAIQEKHQEFIKRAVESKQVWGLESPEGWATAESHDFEDTVVLPFWSDQLYAQHCAVDEWSTYKPSSIELSEFIENWCVGMHNNGELAGTNWNDQLNGTETEPLELILALLKEVKSTGTDLTFKTCPSIEELTQLVDKILKEE